MSPETRACQSCKADFTIEPDDFQFYEKMKVPPPTWCPECRMIRRFIWWNYRTLFRRKEAQEGREVFSMLHPEAPVLIYDRDVWFSDAWDPLAFGREYDATKPFFTQLKELIGTVPWPSRSVRNVREADYTNYCMDAKNAYLCFVGPGIENSAYDVIFNNMKEGFDLYESRHSELCYDSYMVDEAYRVFFSVNAEECTDVWFSRNMIGCSNCFGCVNLRSKSYYIFNKPHTKEEYKEFVDKFKSGSFAEVQNHRGQAQAMWANHPMRFTLAIQTVNSTGEHIEHTKNVKNGYSVHEAENLKYSQFLEKATDSYDFTRAGFVASQVYESALVGYESNQVMFSFNTITGAHDLEYCLNCFGASNCFGCVGLQKKQYCIFNKQYSKDEYIALKEKIIAHMSEMPYRDAQGREYKYGEFFPPELSPFAYNETIAQDFFPLTKETAEAKGYVWREQEQKTFETTKKSGDLPDNIVDVTDDITKELIECGTCKKAYRIIPMELAFYKRITLPLPRLCPSCRFQERFKFVNPPKLWPGMCQCAGMADEKGIYKNDTAHVHGGDHCPNSFETSYAPGRPDIIYCEQCYQAETV